MPKLRRHWDWIGNINRKPHCSLSRTFSVQLFFWHNIYKQSMTEPPIYYFEPSRQEKKKSYRSQAHPNPLLPAAHSRSELFLQVALDSTTNHIDLDADLVL